MPGMNLGDLDKRIEDTKKLVNDGVFKLIQSYVNKIGNDKPSQITDPARLEEIANAPYIAAGEVIGELIAAQQPLGNDIINHVGQQAFGLKPEYKDLLKTLDLSQYSSFFGETAKNFRNYMTGLAFNALETGGNDQVVQDLVARYHLDPGKVKSDIPGVYNIHKMSTDLEGELKKYMP